MKDKIQKKTTDVPTLKLFKGRSEWPSSDLIHHEYIQTRVDVLEGEIHTHRHLDLFHIFYLSRGSAKAVLDGNQLNIHGPILVTIPSLCVHGFSPINPLQGHLLTLPASSVRHLLSPAEIDIDLTETPTIIKGSPGEQFTEVDTLFRQIAKEYKDKRNSHFMAMQSLVRLALVWIIRRQLSDRANSIVVTNDRDAARIRKFKKIIESNFTNNLTVKQYAKELGISSAQLNNICRAKVGKTALQIVHERLMLEAKRNLIYTSYTISEIAYNLGFSDPAYFTRFFSKQTGVSPKQYRSGTRSKQEAPMSSKF